MTFKFAPLPDGAKPFDILKRIEFPMTDDRRIDFSKSWTWRASMLSKFEFSSKKFPTYNTNSKGTSIYISPRKWIWDSLGREEFQEYTYDLVPINDNDAELNPNFIELVYRGNTTDEKILEVLEKFCNGEGTLLDLFAVEGVSSDQMRARIWRMKKANKISDDLLDRMDKARTEIFRQNAFNTVAKRKNKNSSKEIENLDDFLSEIFGG